MSPAVAIVIATRNRGEKIASAIAAVLASDLENIEVVVVDQSDGDETERAVRPFESDPRLLFLRSDLRGLSRARNTAIDHTSAPVIAITDDDCLVPANWAKVMSSAFDADPNVGVVFGSVVALEPGKLGATPQVIFSHPRTVRTVNQAWRMGRTGLCLGASMAVRRTTFDQIGGFDPFLGAGGTFGSLEDNDFSWRSLLQGWHTHVTNQVEVVHDGHRDLDELRELVIRDFFGVGGGLAKYVRTFHPGAWLFVSAWLVNFGIVLPARDVLHGRRPRGFRRPYMLLRGMRAGLATPLDKNHLLYEPKEREPTQRG